MAKTVFILVSSIKNSAPVKGAVALANGLVAGGYDVRMFSMKAVDSKTVNKLDSSVNVIDFSKYKSWWKKRSAIRGMVDNRSHVAISVGFQADVFARFALGGYIKIVSSVRGNLLKAYQFDYGKRGLLLAYIHYLLLRSFDHVVALSDEMENQLRGLGLRRVTVISNFLDEKSLMVQSSDRRQLNRPVHFVYCGRMIAGKGVNSLMKVFENLHDKGMEFQLTFIGEGPLSEPLKKKIADHSLSKKLSFSGFIENPYPMLQSADYMILPSFSEGTSRAVMEALFLGVPCLIRDVDANSLLIESDKQGYLFKNDKELESLLGKVITDEISLKPLEYRSLLPNRFDQKANVQKYMNCFNEI